MKEDHRYDDIIQLPHPTSSVHPRMPLADRAAQFSPFAALTGHQDAILETERITEAWTEPDENEKELLDRRLLLLRKALSNCSFTESGEKLLPEAVFTYFEPDGKKAGGAYVTVKGRVARIDDHARLIVLEDGRRLKLDRIRHISEAP